MSNHSEISIRDGFRNSYQAGDMKPEWKYLEEEVVKFATSVGITNVDQLSDAVGDEAQWNERSVPKVLETALPLVEHCLYAIVHTYSRYTFAQAPGLPELPPYWESMGL